MVDNEWFQDWFDSPFYHKLYATTGESHARSFLPQIVAHLQLKPRDRILELGCGKGESAQFLSDMGMDVTGIDISSTVIEEALLKQTQNLHFFVHDIRLPFWGNYFDAALNLFTRFGYYRTRREHDAAIRTVGRSLRPGGTLLIDYVNVHHAEENFLPQATKIIDGTTYTMRNWHDDTHFYTSIKISDLSLSAPFEVIEKKAKFSLGDFTEMLGFQDMQVKEVFGDYNFAKYHIANTPRMIIIAEKKDSPGGDKEKRIYSDGRTTDPLT